MSFDNVKIIENDLEYLRQISESVNLNDPELLNDIEVLKDFFYLKKSLKKYAQIKLKKEGLLRKKYI